MVQVVKMPANMQLRKKAVFKNTQYVIAYRMRGGTKVHRPKGK